MKPEQDYLNNPSLAGATNAPSTTGQLERVVKPHGELVEIAKRWLWRKCSIVVTEIGGSGRDEPDALGWYGYGGSIFIECKVSRADFLADKHKLWRRFPEHGVGQKRYYLTPKGLLKPDELPDGVGLLEVHGKRVKVIRESQHFDGTMRNETAILMSVIRRIATKPVEGVSVNFYTYETKNRATVGVEKDRAA